MISCPNCGQTLDVGAVQPGSAITCPICARAFVVGGAAQAAAGSPRVATTQWHVLTPDGAQYGPESEQTILGWIREGRIPRGSMVWNSMMADWAAVDRTDPFAGYMPAALASSYAPGRTAYGRHAYGKHHPDVSAGEAVLWFLFCLPIGFMRWGQGGKGLVWVLISVVSCGLGGIVMWVDYWVSFSAQSRRPVGPWEWFPK